MSQPNTLIALYFRRTVRPACFLCFLFVNLPPTASLGDERPLRARLKVRQDDNERPHATFGWTYSERFYYSYRDLKSENQHVAMIGLTVGGPVGIDANVLTAREKNCLVGYPPLKQGDIVPLMGQLARLDDSWEFERLDDDRIPAGLSRPATPFILVSGSGVAIEVYNAAKQKSNLFFLNLLGIENMDDEKDQFRLKIETYEETEKHTSHEVGLKSEIVAGPHHFRVTHIVPPDPQRHIVGWAYLDLVKTDKPEKLSP